mgnify:CR=1 FL=1
MLFGALLIVGLIVGEAFSRVLWLPRITGYVLAGVALGPQGTGLLGSDGLADARVLVDLSIGLIVFELGFRLDFEWLRRNRWLFVSALAESVFCFWAIYAVLVSFDFRPLLAASAAAIGTATSPAVVMLVAHELRAEGQITERALLFTAVNCVFAYVTLTLLLPFLHLENSGRWESALLHPIYLLGGSALAGYAGCRALLWLGGWLGKREDRQFVLLVAAVVVMVGCARSLNLSVMVALVTSACWRAISTGSMHLLPLRFGHGGQLFFVILFVLTGASLEFEAAGAAAAVAVAFIVARFLGKALALLIFGRFAAIRPGGAGLLALALLPMSSLAVLMVHDTSALYPAFGKELRSVVLSAVAVLELLGPIATQYALRHAGEAHPDG